MGANPRGAVTPQVVLGLAVILFGLVLTLDNLDLVDGRQVFRLWPVAVIAIGVSHLTHDRNGPRLLVGVPWIIVGTLLLLSNLGIVHVHVWDLWPLVLIAIGAYLVWQAIDRRRPRSDDGSASVGAVAVMSGIQRKTNAASFRGGELTAVMGGVELDLRQAGLNGGEAVIDVFAFWGGIELRVPENWTVVSKVIPLMGGYEDKTRPPKHDMSHRLVVRGMVIMGGVEVKN